MPNSGSPADPWVRRPPVRRGDRQPRGRAPPWGDARCRNRHLSASRRVSRLDPRIPAPGRCRRGGITHGGRPGRAPVSRRAGVRADRRGGQKRGGRARTMRPMPPEPHGSSTGARVLTGEAVKGRRAPNPHGSVTGARIRDSALGTSGLGRGRREGARTLDGAAPLRVPDTGHRGRSGAGRDQAVRAPRGSSTLLSRAPAPASAVASAIRAWDPASDPVADPASWSRRSRLTMRHPWRRRPASPSRRPRIPTRSRRDPGRPPRRGLPRARPRLDPPERIRDINCPNRCRGRLDEKRRLARIGGCERLPAAEAERGQLPAVLVNEPGEFGRAPRWRDRNPRIGERPADAPCDEREPGAA